MCLKGYSLWAMGQLDSTCKAPPLRVQDPHAAPLFVEVLPHAVGVRQARVAARVRPAAAVEIGVVRLPHAAFVARDVEKGLTPCSHLFASIRGLIVVINVVASVVIKGLKQLR